MSLLGPERHRRSVCHSPITSPRFRSPQSWTVIYHCLSAFDGPGRHDRRSGGCRGVPALGDAPLGARRRLSRGPHLRFGNAPKPWPPSATSPSICCAAPRISTASKSGGNPQPVTTLTSKASPPLGAKALRRFFPVRNRDGRRDDLEPHAGFAGNGCCTCSRSRLRRGGVSTGRAAPMPDKDGARLHPSRRSPRDRARGRRALAARAGAVQKTGIVFAWATGRRA